MTDFSTPGMGRTEPSADTDDYADEGFGSRRDELVQRFQESAEYFRNLEPEQLRAEFEESIRARPLLSVALAAAAGFLLGRLIRR